MSPPQTPLKQTPDKRYATGTVEKEDEFKDPFMETLNEWRSTNNMNQTLRHSQLSDPLVIKKPPTEMKTRSEKTNADTQLEVYDVVKESCWQCYKVSPVIQMAIFM